MQLLNCRGISKSFGDLHVLKDINLDISTGEQIGLVGRNGTGKTTLANIIFGNLKSDKGIITQYKQGIRIGYLLQSTSYTLNTFNCMLNKSNSNDMMRDFLEVTSNLGLKKIQEWNLSRFSGLSGGEKTKLALANIWATNPDILILDEPTNHLDFRGVEWLVNELKKYHGAALIISHDRYFLDQIVNQIIELEDGVLNNYAGNYSFYRKEKTRRYNEQLHQFTVQKKYQEKIGNEIERLTNWSTKAHRDARKSAIKTGNKFGGKEHNRAKAKKMDKQIKSRIKRLERLKTEGVSRPKEESKVNFNFDNPEKRGKRILEAKNIAKRYGNKILFQDSSFCLLRGDRIGLLGENGCGKTTLIRIFIGDENIDQGEVWMSSSVKIAYLSQDVTDMNVEQTTLELIDENYGLHNSIARTVLANMGFNEAMLKKPIKNLSLGERTRIKIADLILKENDLLILDEPTNHLDIHSKEQLEETLSDYNGTILIVSHDRYMLERLCEKVLVFEDGKIQKVESGFKKYMKKKIERESSSRMNKENKTDEKIIIENRMAFLLGELSKYSPEDTEYTKLDIEFKELVRKKKELVNSISH